MVGSYTGAWKRNQYFEQPSPVQIVNIEDHSEPGQQDEPQWTDVHTAPVVKTDPGFDFIGDEYWATGYDSGEPGVMIDTTPVDHAHAGSHDLNEGAPQARTMRRDTDVRGPGESYAEQRWDGFGPEASQISYEALMRGINSQPQNNPPLEMYDGRGFRYGIWEFLTRGRDRRFLVKPIRTEHGVRALYPITAHIPPDSAYKKGAYLPSSLASPIDRRLKRPMLARTPPRLGDVIAQDGSPTDDDSNSIIGVF